MDITSANAVIIYRDRSLILAGIPLIKFSTDQSLSQDEVVYAETRMGVDGGMSAGYTPNIVPVTIMFEADSPSWRLIAQSFELQKTLKRPLKVSLEMFLPSILKTYRFNRGVLKSMTDVGLKKVLDPVTLKFEFESRSGGL